MGFFISVSVLKHFPVPISNFGFRYLFGEGNKVQVWMDMEKSFPIKLPFGGDEIIKHVQEMKKGDLIEPVREILGLDDRKVEDDT